MTEQTDRSTPPRPPRQALSGSEIAAQLARLRGWRHSGAGAGAAIEKTYQFDNYYQTMAFVNALAFIAHALDHHPDLSVHYGCCVVRLSTHDVQGISATDFDCAAHFDGLLD